MSEHDTEERLRSWAHSPVEASAPDDLRRQVLAIPTTETATRRRLWYLPGPKPTAGAEATARPGPVAGFHRDRSHRRYQEHVLGHEDSWPWPRRSRSSAP